MFLSPMAPPERRIITFSRGWRETATTAAAAALLGLFWWQAVTASIEKSHTSDELPHIAAGYAFNHFGDFRMHPENGVLPQRLFGLSVPARNVRFPIEPDLWPNSTYWPIAWDFFYSSNNLTDWIVLRARAVNALLGVALGALIFAIARKRYGRGGAVLALAFYATAPNFLAHAGLATSDMAASLFLPLAAFVFWLHLLRRDFRSGVVASMVGGLALAAKFNGLLLLPIFLALAVSDAWQHGRETSVRIRRFATNLGRAALVGAGATVVIWAFFNFRFSPRGANTPEFFSFAWSWEEMFGLLGWKRGVIEALRAWHVLPDAWIYGLTNVLAGEAERPAFFAGEHSLRGWWQFFPTLFLTKTPLAMLLALLAAAVASVIAWRRKQATVLLTSDGMWPIVVTALVVGWFAVTSNLNIGDRHILAVYPALFVALGTLVRFRETTIVALALLAGQMAESIAIRPHYLAYFNALAGGPTRAYKLVSDSALYWGQDLPALQQWLTNTRRDGEMLYLGYFGSAWPPHYGVRPQYFLPAGTYVVRPPLVRYELLPGVYAISATLLNEVYSPYRGPWSPEREHVYRTLRAKLAPAASATVGQSTEFEVFDRLRFARLCKYLQARTPDAFAGYSILIFRLTAAEIRQALDQPVVHGHRIRIDKNPVTRREPRNFIIDSAGSSR